MEGSQRKQHLDRGAIGIGDNIVLFGKDIGVDLGNDQFLCWIHPPAGGIVNDTASCLSEFRSPLF